MTLQETREFLRREQERNDLRAVMDTAAGRRFVWKLLSDAGVFRSSYVAGQADTTAFNEGGRNRGLTLLGDIMNDAPEKYLIMQKEAIDNDQKQREGSSGDNDGAQAGAYPGDGDSYD